MSPVTDRELLRGLHKGHGETLRCVYERYKDSMFALAVTLSRDRSVAEDVVTRMQDYRIYVDAERKLPVRILFERVDDRLSQGPAHCVD